MVFLFQNTRSLVSSQKRCALVEDCKFQNCLQYHTGGYHARSINRRRYISDIVHTLLGIAVFWKVWIQPTVASWSTDVEIRYVYNNVNEAKVIMCYMEALALHTGKTTIYLEDKKLYLCCWS